MKNLIIFFILLTLTKICFSQETYEFGHGGGICNFNFMCYAPNNEYMNKNRPYIIIIGKKGEDSKAAYESDTLRNISSFFTYMFVYVPNSAQLQCIEPLMSLLTFDYNYGHKNLFLYIKDTNIKPTDGQAKQLHFAFNNIYLEKPKQKIKEKDIDSLFKQDLTVVQAQMPTINENDIEDDDSSSNNESTVSLDNRKVYFGPPKVFNFTLSGVLKDAKTGEALPFATVGLINGTNVTTSNNDGFFTLLNVPTDTSTLVVQYIGYQTTKVYLTPQTPKRHLPILVYPNSQTLQVVSVTADRYELMKTDKTRVDVVQLSPKEIEKLPSLGEPDVLRSLQLMPGVSAANESSSGLYVQGGTPDQNLVLFDGFTVYHVDHLYGFFSAFNSSVLKEVDLFKGGYEAKYGGRLSSVTDITGKDGDQNKFNMGASISFLSFNVFAEVPIGKKFSSIVAFRKSYQGIIYNEIFDKFNKNSNSSESSASTPTPPSGGGPPGGGGFGQAQTTPTSYFYDLNGKFTYRPNDKDIISLSVYNGTDYLNNSSSFSGFISASNTDLTNYGNTGSSLKWSRKWTDKIYGTTLISYSNYFSDRTLSNSGSFDNNGTTTSFSSGIFEDNNLKDYSFKSDYQWDIFSGNQLQFGVFASYYDIKFTYSQNDTATIINTHNYGSLSGAYLQDKIKLFTDKIQLLPGIRTSYFGVTQNTYYEPRASLIYNLTDNITVKGATGKYYQYVNQITQEDVLTGSTNFWLLANGNQLPVSSSIHYVANIAYEQKGYMFSVEGYYKQLSGLSQYSLSINPSPTSVSYQENFYTGTGYSKGIEFLAQKKSGKFNGWISYTISTTMNRFTALSPYYFPASQDAPNEVHLVGMYKWRRWDLSATWIYATGLPYTAPSGSYGITLLNGTTQYYYTVTSENSLRLPDYNRLDLAANYELYFNVGRHHRRDVGYIGFSIFNVYDRKNIWYRTYTVEDGTIVQTNVNYLGLTPNITLSIKLH